jgi:hypothetical protein
MAPPRQAARKRRLRPPTPPPPRWRLPVAQRAFWGGIAVGLGVSGAFLVLFFTRHTSPPAPSANAPWGPNTAGLRKRLRALGLPVLAQQGTALHIHQHLDLYLNGRHVAVPANVGIGSGFSFFSPLHTHDRSGILHVESPTKTTYTLGQFFGVWGVRISPTCLGGDCTGAGRSLVAFVNGHRVHGNPALIPLRPHEEIVLALGTSRQLPSPIPSTYHHFPPGY